MRQALQRAVLFDYDDTLVQTQKCKYQAIAAVAERHYGATLTSAQIDAHWGVAYHTLFERLFRELDTDLARVIRRYEALNDEFPIVAYEDAIETLDVLLRRELVLGVVSSAGEIVKRQMLQVGIPLARLSFVQTAEDSAQHKPDPRVFEPALRKLAAHGIGASEVTYVGDSLSDFRAAQGAGLAFIGIHGRTTEAREFQRAGALSVASLREIGMLGSLEV